jgi:hypothetical protein
LFVALLVHSRIAAVKSIRKQLLCIIVVLARALACASQLSASALRSLMIRDKKEYPGLSRIGDEKGYSGLSRIGDEKDIPDRG